MHATERMKRVRALFDDLVSLSPDLQRRRLQEACGDTPDILREVQALLVADASDSPLDTATHAGMARVVVGARDPGLEPLGPYVLDEVHRRTLRVAHVSGHHPSPLRAVLLLELVDWAHQSEGEQARVRRRAEGDARPAGPLAHRL